jgi:hypothetical protein
VNASVRALVRLSFGNASLLSGLYLAIATTVELVRRQWNFFWADRLSLAFEMMPARSLEWLGLLRPLRNFLVAQAWPNWAVRVVYGGVSVATIFILGLMVGMTLGGFALWVAPKEHN